LAFEVFGGRDWDRAANLKWNAAHGPPGISFKAVLLAISDVAGRSDWQSPIYLLFAPLAFLRAQSRRFVIPITVYLVYLFTTWFLLTHRLDRFWLPLLPPLALLAGLGFDWPSQPRVAWSIWRMVLITIVMLANLSFITTPLCGPTDWTGDLAALRSGALRMANPPLAALDRILPEDSKVLIVGQAGTFYFERPLLYNTVFNQERIEELTRDREPSEIWRGLRRLGVTHVYVDWSEVDRHRKPGGYGYSTWVDHQLFDRLWDDHILGPPVRVTPDGSHVLYPVLPTEPVGQPSEATR
jgi:hypothetical protein